jgi:multidrug efflux pump subunit AcrA (membrane-fusion protein)
VVVAVDNPDRALFPGMTADTHIVSDEHDDVLRVPLPAVRFNPEGIARSIDNGARKEEGGGPAPRESGPGTRTGEGRRASTGTGSGARLEGAGEGHARPGRRAASTNTERPGGRERWGEARPAEVSARKSRVWVLNDDGKLRPVEVSTGLDDGALIEVSGEGLKAGDKVVVNQIVPGDQGRGAAGTGTNPAFRAGQGQGPGPGGPRL